MDTSEIVLALVAGAKFVGTEGAKAVVKDAYSGLKDVISQRFKRAEPAIMLIEDDPQDAALIPIVEKKLVDTGAINDAELQEKAILLLEAIKNNLNNDTAQKIGIDLERIKAKTLRIRNLQSAGDTIVQVTDANIKGDLEIGDIYAGSSDPN